ncbi:MAG: HD domain-containing protein [Bacteroidota bacterium]|jgi:putative hydrolase of HD superfamily
MTTVSEIYTFIHSAEKLKNELRHSFTSSGRQESVAEHTWRMSLMAILLFSKLDKKVNFEKLLKMIIIHDIVEIEAGDTPVPLMVGNDLLKRQKEEREKKAIDSVRKQLGDDLGVEFYRLWYEFEAQETYEAKVANALDKLEVQIQHNEADINTWIPVEYELIYSRRAYTAFDPAMDQLRVLIEQEAEAKLAAAGIALRRPE